MTETYQIFDRTNLVDNQGAFDALVKSGIEEVEFNAEEFAKTRSLLLESNIELGAEGAFTLKLYKEMLQHIDEFRSEQAAATGDPALRLGHELRGAFGRREDRPGARGRDGGHRNLFR